jgi:putative spermidine/putrescine transport system substrate-binding protein
MPMPKQGGIRYPDPATEQQKGVEMTMIKGNLAVLCTVSLLALGGAATAQERTLNVMHAGGEFGDALTQCVDNPLQELSGIRVVTETPGGFAKMQAQARSGVITNATTDGSTGDLYRMIAADLIEPIDWDAVGADEMFEDARHEYGFGQSYFSTIMAWRSDAEAPSDFVEFFDTENFPGRRALPDYPDYVLAFAAMGDGMTVEEIAEGIDLDRAFATLERVKDDVIWWQSGAQPAQLLKDNEAQYAIAWSGRVVDEEGVSHTFNQGMLDYSWWVQAKGISDEQREALYEWFRIQSEVERQVCMVEAIPYPGPSPMLAEQVSDDIAVKLPTHPDNFAVQWAIDGQWWYDNADEVERRWNEFKLLQ